MEGLWQNGEQGYFPIYRACMCRRLGRFLFVYTRVYNEIVSYVGGLTLTLTIELGNNDNK